MQLLIKRVVKELIAAHADVLPSSPAFAELFSTAVRPHLLSASDIPDGTMVFIRRRTTDTHSLPSDSVRSHSKYVSDRKEHVQLPALPQLTPPTDKAVKSALAKGLKWLSAGNL